MLKGNSALRVCNSAVGSLATAIALCLATPALAQQAYDPTYAGPVTGEPDGLNPAWYLAHNPDVAAAINGGWAIDPLTHWEQYGAPGSPHYDGKKRQPYDPAYIAPVNPMTDVLARVAALEAASKAVPTPAPVKNQTKLAIGVNMPGYEAWGSDARYGYGYVLPDLNDVKALVAKGLPNIRLPFNWGRFQSAKGGPLNAAEVARFRDWLTQAKAAGAFVQIENHGYANTGWGTNLGQDRGALAQFSVAMTAALSDVISGYGIMNEPANVSADIWYAEAGQTDAALIAAGFKLPIYVDADGWSKAGSWVGKTPFPDPKKQNRYEAHAYPDPDDSGTFSDTTNIVALADRIAGFSAWLTANGLQGSIGEYGTLADDAHVVALDAALDALVKAPGITSFNYWCATGWGDTRVAAFLNGQSKPQMAPLIKVR